MRYVVIDTETNGLPKYNLPADHPDQCRLAELCLYLLKDDKSIEEVYHAYVQPDGWAMEAEAAAVNCLTIEFLKEHGKPIGDVLAVYSQAIRERRVIVAHHAQHDCKVMRGELRRNGMDDLFMLTRNTCTMRSANGIVVKEGGRKGWPKLDDCCAHFGIPKEPKPHGAKAGAEACYQVFLALDKLGAMQEPEVHRAKAGTAAGEAAGLGPAAPRGRSAPKIKPAAAPVTADSEIPE